MQVEEASGQMMIINSLKSFFFSMDTEDGNKFKDLLQPLVADWETNLYLKLKLIRMDFYVLWLTQFQNKKPI